MNRLIAHIGSLRATLALFALLAAVVLAQPAWWPLAAVFALLGANLGMALVVHPGLRRKGALLVAHLALLMLVVGVGLGRLLALDGRFELTEGVPFDGTLIDGDRGAWHRDRLATLAFTQHGFEIAYAPGRKRGATRNAVSWHDDAGREQRATIGDHRPLVLDGHRFYTSPNKGFAPVLAWHPHRGDALRGAVHLPSFPVHELAQWREWTLPDGRAVWVQLHFDEALIPADRATEFRRPGKHRLVVRVGDRRVELAPGASLEIDGGTLVYERLAIWMGYRVTYDPTLPWLLAAAIVAALALGLHYALEFRSRAARASTAPARSLEWADG